MALVIHVLWVVELVKIHNLPLRCFVQTAILLVKPNLGQTEIIAKGLSKLVPMEQSVAGIVYREEKGDRAQSDTHWVDHCPSNNYASMQRAP